MADISRGLFPTGLTDNNFNVHGGLVAAEILNRMVDLMLTDGGVVIRDTSDTGLKVIDAGDGKISVKAGTAYDKFGQRINIPADDAGSGIYTGTVDLSSGVDLSTNKNIKLDIDNAGAVQIDCQGATPAATTIDEIMAAINAAGFGTICYRSDDAGNPVTTGSYLTIKSPTAGGSSEIEFLAPASLDATAEIFGLNEASYPHTYVGGGGYAVPDDSATYNVVIEHQIVKSVPGNFEAGYPLNTGDQYTKQTNSYKVTVTASNPVSDGNQHELLLAQVINMGGGVVVTDKRGDSILYLQGAALSDTTPPPAPVKVWLKSFEATADQSKVALKWDKVTDPSGIKAYKISLELIEVDGVAVDSEFEEHSWYNFPGDANTLQWMIMKPNGYKYRVKLAAMDNSINQNLSPWTDFGTILNGTIYAGVEDDETPLPIDDMGTVISTPKHNSVQLDWAPVDHVKEYEIAYTVNGGRPSFGEGGQVVTTNNPRQEIAAPAGSEVRAIVRPKRPDRAEAKQQEVRGLAGGTIIGNNEKTIPLVGKSVLATADGKSARFLGRIRLPNRSNIEELAASIESIALNSSARGVIRAYPQDSEGDAITLTFTANGPASVEMDDDLIWDAGWVTLDAYDSAESGTTQAAFSADIFLKYTENKVGAAKASSSEKASKNI